MATQDQTKFTCFTCRVGFPSADAQRLHYKTEWHRYNLKRKVAGMAAVSADAFRARVVAQKEEQAALEAQDNAFNCDICSKKFNSKNALDSHFQSKKHKLAVANPQETVAAPKAAVVDAAHMQPIAEQQRKYAALQKRLRAEYEAAEAAEAKGEAASAHAQGLAAARQELEQQVLSTDSNAMATEADDATPQEAPILELVDCIFDTYRADTFEDNVTYMSETHGFFIPNLEYVVDLEGLFRYLQVKVGNYFTCISCNKNLMDLEGVRRHMADKGHKHIDYSEDGQLEIGEYYDFSSTYPDDSGLTEEDRDADLTVATMAARSGQAYREGYDLVLPSGRRAGHRELQRYYKQHFKPEDQRDSVRIGRIAAQYRALGHKGFGLPSELIRKDQLYAQRRIGRNRLDVGVKANKLQHHFREQVLQ